MKSIILIITVFITLGCNNKEQSDSERNYNAQKSDENKTTSAYKNINLKIAIENTIEQFYEESDLRSENNIFAVFFFEESGKWKALVMWTVYYLKDRAIGYVNLESDLIVFYSETDVDFYLEFINPSKLDSTVTIPIFKYEEQNNREMLYAPYNPWGTIFTLTKKGDVTPDEPYREFLNENFPNLSFFATTPDTAVGK